MKFKVIIFCALLLCSKFVVSIPYAEESVQRRAYQPNYWHGKQNIANNYHGPDFAQAQDLNSRINPDDHLEYGDEHVSQERQNVDNNMFINNPVLQRSPPIKDNQGNFASGSNERKADSYPSRVNTFPIKTENQHLRTDNQQYRQNKWLTPNRFLNSASTANIPAVSGPQRPLSSVREPYHASDQHTLYDPSVQNYGISHVNNQAEGINPVTGDINYHPVGVRPTNIRYVQHAGSEAESSNTHVHYKNHKDMHTIPINQNVVKHNSGFIENPSLYSAPGNSQPHARYHDTSANKLREIVNNPMRHDTHNANMDNTYNIGHSVPIGTVVNNANTKPLRQHVITSAPIKRVAANTYQRPITPVDTERDNVRHTRYLENELKAPQHISNRRFTQNPVFSEQNTRGHNSFHALVVPNDNNPVDFEPNYQPSANTYNEPADIDSGSKDIPLTKSSPVDRYNETPLTSADVNANNEANPLEPQPVFGSNAAPHENNVNQHRNDLHHVSSERNQGNNNMQNKDKQSKKLSSRYMIIHKNATVEQILDMDEFTKNNPNYIIVKRSELPLNGQYYKLPSLSSPPRSPPMKDDEEPIQNNPDSSQSNYSPLILPPVLSDSNDNQPLEPQRFTSNNGNPALSEQQSQTGNEYYPPQPITNDDNSAPQAAQSLTDDYNNPSVPPSPSVSEYNLPSENRYPNIRKDHLPNKVGLGNYPPLLLNKHTNSPMVGPDDYDDDKLTLSNNPDNNPLLDTSHFTTNEKYQDSLTPSEPVIPKDDNKYKETKPSDDLQDFADFAPSALDKRTTPAPSDTTNEENNKLTPASVLSDHSKNNIPISKPLYLQDNNNNKTPSPTNEAVIQDFLDSLSSTSSKNPTSEPSGPLDKDSKKPKSPPLDEDFNDKVIPAPYPLHHNKTFDTSDEIQDFLDSLSRRPNKNPVPAWFGPSDDENKKPNFILLTTGQNDTENPRSQPLYPESKCNETTNPSDDFQDLLVSLPGESNKKPTPKTHEQSDNNDKNPSSALSPSDNKDKKPLLESLGSDNQDETKNSSTPLYHNSKDNDETSLVTIKPEGDGSKSAIQDYNSTQGNNYTTISPKLHTVISPGIYRSTTPSNELIEQFLDDIDDKPSPDTNESIRSTNSSSVPKSNSNETSTPDANDSYQDSNNVTASPVKIITQTITISPIEFETENIKNVSLLETTTPAYGKNYTEKNNTGPSIGKDAHDGVVIKIITDNNNKTTEVFRKGIINKNTTESANTKVPATLDDNSAVATDSTTQSDKYTAGQSDTNEIIITLTVPSDSDGNITINVEVPGNTGVRDKSADGTLVVNINTQNCSGGESVTATTCASTTKDSNEDKSTTDKNKNFVIDLSNSTILWNKTTDKEFFEQNLNNATVCVMYVFQVQPQPIIEKSKITTIFANSTVVEEITETTWQNKDDKEPTIVSTKKVFNKGVGNA